MLTFVYLHPAVLGETRASRPEQHHEVLCIARQGGRQATLPWSQGLYFGKFTFFGIAVRIHTDRSI